MIAPGIDHIALTVPDLVEHERLVVAGMETSEAPQRRDFARMYTSFLKQDGGVEVQLVRDDDRV